MNAPPIPDQARDLFARVNGDEPIVSVKCLDRCMSLTLRKPGESRFTLEMHPQEARELAARLIDGARTFETR